MKGYFAYVKRGLLWSLPVAIASYVTDIIKNNDYGVFDLIVTIIVFVFILGPIGGKFLQKNKKHDNIN